MRSPVLRTLCCSRRCWPTCGGSTRDACAPLCVQCRPVHHLRGLPPLTVPLLGRFPRRSVAAAAHSMGPLERALRETDPGIFECETAGARPRQGYCLEAHLAAGWMSSKAWFERTEDRDGARMAQARCLQSRRAQWPRQRVPSEEHTTLLLRACQTTALRPPRLRKRECRQQRRPLPSSWRPAL